MEFWHGSGIPGLSWIRRGDSRDPAAAGAWATDSEPVARFFALLGELRGGTPTLYRVRLEDGAGARMRDYRGYNEFLLEVARGSDGAFGIGGEDPLDGWRRRTIQAGASAIRLRGCRTDVPLARTDVAVLGDEGILVVEEKAVVRLADLVEDRDPRNAQMLFAEAVRDPSSWSESCLRAATRASEDLRSPDLNSEGGVDAKKRRLGLASVLSSLPAGKEALLGVAAEEIVSAAEGRFFDDGFSARIHADARACALLSRAADLRARMEADRIAPGKDRMDKGR